MKKQKRHSFILFCLGCLLTMSVGCARQEASLGYDGDHTSARVPIHLRASGGSVAIDKQVKTIRLIFFTQSGKLVSNWLYSVNDGTDPSIVTGEMTIGMNNIYVVCNETPELGRDLSNVTTPEQIAAIRFTPPAGGITDPVPMYAYLPDVKIERGNGSSVNVTIGNDTKPYLEATVKRIVARIGLKVIKNISSNDVNFSIERLSYRICRVPAYSMLAEGGAKFPQGGGWGDDISVEGEGRIAAGSNGDYVVSGDVVSTNPTNLDVINCPVVYLPEHLPQSPENPNYCTYLLIEADCLTEHSSTPIRSVYRINMGKLPPTDLSIERNVNYQVCVKITGLGATGFYAEIVPVDEYDLPITWKPTEGYTIVGERVEDYGVNVNIWKSYSQYSGILKVVKDKTYSNVCFRYGSVVALSATTTAGAFNPSTDVSWMPEVTKNNTPINAWNDVQHLSATDDVSASTHTLENIKLGKGDPCRLVGLSEEEIASGTIDNKLWRLPTQSEMQWLLAAQNYTADLRGHFSFSTLLSPFNGSRTEAGIMVPSDATTGHYWSATAANSFAFSSNSSATIATDDPQKAYSVRCLRTDIPESIFDAHGSDLTYLGGVVQISSSINNIITPYWRMEVTDPVSVQQLTLAKTEGASKEPIAVTVKPLPKPYEQTTYSVNVTGYGLDGRIHQRTATILQKALHHDVVVNWTSVPTLTESEGYYRIPIGGATLSFTMQITPEPLPPYNPNFDDKLWCIRCKYYTDVLNEVYGTQAKRNEASVITIPPNTWGHILGFEFDMVPVDNSYPPYKKEVEVIIQNVK